MLKKKLIIIHWFSFITVIILISLTIIKIISINLLNPETGEVSPEMIDRAALQIILYFLLMPLFTIVYWSLMRAWVFFPWQHKNNKS